MKDLLDECGKDLSLLGYKCKKAGEYGLEICQMSVKGHQQEKETGFEEGEYVVLNCKNLPFCDADCAEFVSKHLQKVLKTMLADSSLTRKSRFLIVGLGNPNILADSLGTKVLENVPIDVLKNKSNVFKFAPNIFVNTGINALDVVGMLAVWLDIDAVFVIDSLATDCIDRVACSLQVNTAGITPGSALNNLGKKIGKSTLGIPCISIGVPLMFYGHKYGKKEMLLTPKDIHQNVDNLAYVIGDAISGVLL